MSTHKFQHLQKLSLNKQLKGAFYIKTLFFLVFFINILPAYGAQTSTMYLRSDTKTSNGVIIESNLLIVPAEDDFRIKKFNCYSISGSAVPDAKPDVLSAAKHNAFLNLLLSQGVKSVANRSELKNSSPYEESVLSYEGFIKSAYTITKQGYNSNKTEFIIEIDVLFAPMAYPSEWSFYYFKKKLYEAAQSMISLFK